MAGSFNPADLAAGTVILLVKRVSADYKSADLGVSCLFQGALDGVLTA
jgi:hypothetical protein